MTTSADCVDHHSSDGKKVPVNLVVGSLGVGKTTAIAHLLENRPRGERWAVLVNEYGLVGLDAALLADSASSDGIDVREVAGGCICCSAGLLFEISLAVLLDQQPDRILIEPSGLAALSGILDTLGSKHIRERIDVRSTICLLDATTVAQDRVREEVEDQIESADILLANRVDLASEEEIEDFLEWANAIFPAKSYVGCVEQGRITLEMLDAVVDDAPIRRSESYGHGTDHHHPHVHDAGTADAGGDETDTQEPAPDASNVIIRRCHISPSTSTIGWVCSKELVLESEKAVRLLADLTRLPNARRTKAVLRTEDGWWSFNLTKEMRDGRPSAYRRDSRIEVILDGDEIPDLDEVERALLEMSARD